MMDVIPGHGTTARRSLAAARDALLDVHRAARRVDDRISAATDATLDAQERAMGAIDDAVDPYMFHDRRALRTPATLIMFAVVIAVYLPQLVLRVAHFGLRLGYWMGVLYAVGGVVGLLVAGVAGFQTGLHIALSAPVVILFVAAVGAVASIGRL